MRIDENQTARSRAEWPPPLQTLPSLLLQNVSLSDASAGRDVRNTPDSYRMLHRRSPALRAKSRHITDQSNPASKCIRPQTTHQGSGYAINRCTNAESLE
jgi:hypothetical protein